MTIRITSGSLRGRKIEVPDGRHTRPTSARTREAIMSALSARNAISGARVLDAFAGTGALGLEAISRGAAHATFCENDRNARRVLAENISQLGVDAQCTILDRAKRALPTESAYDLVFLDPPYAKQALAESLLTSLNEADALTKSHQIVWEMAKQSPVAFDGAWRNLSTKTYGDTVVCIGHMAKIIP